MVKLHKYNFVEEQKNKYRFKGKCTFSRKMLEIFRFIVEYLTTALRNLFNNPLAL